MKTTRPPREHDSQVSGAEHGASWRALLRSNAEMALTMMTKTGMTRKRFLANEASLSWWLQHLDIEVVEAFLPTLMCSRCRAGWQPSTYSNGRWRSGWYRCPRRCTRA
jgi:hypothetical protein